MIASAAIFLLAQLAVWAFKKWEMREPRSLTADEVERVVAAHRAALKQVCWKDQTHAAAPSKVTLSIVVGANGDVVSATSNGDDALVASCVEAQVRTWQFPAHGERTSTVQLPFLFVHK